MTPSHRPNLRRRALVLATTTALAASALLPLGTAQAQAFPAKPITLIVPWPAGGSTDRHLRTLAEIASTHLGQNIVIENKPGAGGTLGPATMAATAKPDGYTIAQFPLGMLRMPHMQKTNWDPINDFSYII
ncbi:MAG: tripartite tricarboxylate transporter substrate-binding protein, partial [Burkholderiaceae bacterium]|nr:tripartite tricarboxylate transporter substrate-binding protein [Burkholderiaceae bacterium]